MTRSPFCVDAGAAVPGDKILRADPLAHRGQQHALQVGARQADVRPVVPGRLAERLAIDELAVAGEEGVVLRLAGGRDQRVLKPERARAPSSHARRYGCRCRARASRTPPRTPGPGGPRREACNASASVSPPIPPPMTIASMRAIDKASAPANATGQRVGPAYRTVARHGVKWRRGSAADAEAARDTGEDRAVSLARARPSARPSSAVASGATPIPRNGCWSRTTSAPTSTS